MESSTTASTRKGECVLPLTEVDIFAVAYPSRRFQSAWMGIIVHSVQSVVVIIVVLAVVA
jgi:hypothetical protein